jgi:hypothetical protein
MGEETEIDSAAKVIRKRVSTPLHGKIRIDSGFAPRRGVETDRLIGQYIFYCSSFVLVCGDVRHGQTRSKEK